MCEVQTIPADNNILFAHVILRKDIKEKVDNGLLSDIDILDAQIIHECNHLYELNFQKPLYSSQSAGIG